MFRKITVAFDESPEAGRALQVGVELAKSLNASLTIVSAIEPAPIYFSFSTSATPYIRWTDEMRTRYIGLQAKAREFAEGAGLAIEAELSKGDEVESILEAARHNPIRPSRHWHAQTQFDNWPYCTGSCRARPLRSVRNQIA